MCMSGLSYTVQDGPEPEKPFSTGLDSERQPLLGLDGHAVKRDKSRPRQ